MGERDGRERWEREGKEGEKRGGKSTGLRLIQLGGPMR